MGRYSTNILTGGTASADTVYQAFVAANAVDGNEATYWESTNTVFPHWWKYDLGAAVKKRAAILRMKCAVIMAGIGVKNFKLQGSNNDSDWVDLLTSITANNANWQEWLFTPGAFYRYFRVYVTDDWEGSYNYCVINEIEIMAIKPTLFTFHG